LLDPQQQEILILLSKDETPQGVRKYFLPLTSPALIKGEKRMNTPEPLTMVSFRLEQSIIDKLKEFQKKEKIRTKTEALRRIIIEAFENK
jgi:hypothetical protein